MTDTAAPIESHTPSAKLVYKVLEHGDGPLSQKEIAKESRLPIRTVRGAIYDLRDAGIVEERTPVTDPRGRVYQIVYG